MHERVGQLRHDVDQAGRARCRGELKAELGLALIARNPAAILFMRRLSTPAALGGLVTVSHIWVAGPPKHNRPSVRQLHPHYLRSLWDEKPLVKRTERPLRRRRPQQKQVRLPAGTT